MPNLFVIKAGFTSNKGCPWGTDKKADLGKIFEKNQ
jgi:hypothetical protein